MNILIVDDEVTALRDMARVLKKVVPDAAVKKADEADAGIRCGILRHQYARKGWACSGKGDEEDPPNAQHCDGNRLHAACP